MEHKCCADDCDDPHIKQREEVVQLLRGHWYGAITPGFEHLEKEWHRKCFHEFKLSFHGQHRPYFCVNDNQRIKFGEEVYFYVVGSETDEYNTVCEARGYEICCVMHVKCPQSLSTPPSWASKSFP